MSYTFFISYARIDSEIALKVANHLKSNGADLWMDQMNIKAGQNWNLEIEDALAACKCVVVLLSPSSAASINVRKELLAADREGKRIVPVNIVPTNKIPLVVEGMQHVDLITNFDAGLQHLLRELDLSGGADMPPTQTIKKDKVQPVAEPDTRVQKKRPAAQPAPENSFFDTGKERLSTSNTQSRETDSRSQDGSATEKRPSQNEYSHHQAAQKLFDQGIQLYFGENLVQDFKQAKILFEKAAALGNAEAMNSIGWLFFQGQGVPQNYEKAKTWFEKAAALDIIDSMTNLGLFYEDGLGVKQDIKQSKLWYEKAAKSGSPLGMCKLGDFYNFGKGVQQSFEKAISWYERSAELDFPDAMRNLGTLYVEGNGVAQDFQQAKRWFERAADLDDAEAMNNLGSMYLYGNGVRKDTLLARQWIEKSAALGNLPAMFNMGWLYQNQGDYGQALHWYEQAASLGDADAMKYIAVLYHNGLGVQKNRQEAAAWLQQAAALGTSTLTVDIEGQY